MPSREEIARWLRQAGEFDLRYTAQPNVELSLLGIEGKKVWEERAAQVENMCCENCNSKDELLKEMAMAIHYPRCWDTMAYPTLADAVIEVYKSFRCERRGCH